MEGAELGVLGMPALHSRDAARFPLEGKQCPLVGPCVPSCSLFSSSPGLHLGRGFFVLHIWQKLFLHHK